MPFGYLNQERLVGKIGAGGICMRVGEMSIKYPKRKWNRTEGRGHKDFKGGGGKLGQGVGALKRGGLEPP